MTRDKNLKGDRRTKVIFARGQDMLDPEKRDDIINQMLDQLEADGHKFVPEDESAAADCAQAAIDEAIGFARQGRHADALAASEKALATSRETKGKSESLARLSAHALANKGAALGGLERFTEAVQCYDAALVIEKQLARDGESGQCVRDRSITTMNKAWALMNLGRTSDALVCYEEALGPLQKLVADGQVEFARAVGLVHYNIGEALIRAGRCEEALAQHDEALSVWQRLIDEQPPIECDFELDMDVAYGLSSRADILMQLGRFDEALESADKSIAIFRKWPCVAENRKLTKDLAIVLNLRGTILNKLGRLTEAQACFREAVKLREAN